MKRPENRFFEWKELDETARKSVIGYCVVIDKDERTEIIDHTLFDDTMLYYYKIPFDLTKKQIKMIEMKKKRYKKMKQFRNLNLSEKYLIVPQDL